MARKKLLLVPWVPATLFFMAFLLYICSLCFKQISFVIINGENTIDIIPRPLNSEHHVHYPKPNTYNREECAENPVRFFAIVSMQRSGSGWFEALLNSHTNVSSNGEIFTVKDRKKNITTILKTMDKVYNLDWSSSASKNECIAAFGFKWMLNQGLVDHHKEIAEYFQEKGISAIFFFRRNLLRRMISVLANSYDKNVKQLNGTHKSHVNTPHKAQVLAKHKPTINATSVINDLKTAEDLVTNAIEYFKSTHHIVLYYEDLINNNTKLIDVQEFLGLPHEDLQSNQIKIHNGSLSDQVNNWDDILKEIKESPYAKFLQSDY